ncbi:hypothetical protein [Maribacter halichondriae]|uniref:hypothetical protein n=1 Tax=Maribacter halichondriae TaxID=2980554 RepID=UPI00235854A8|nr:hypothetical protein [Maribacter sp. Hal144]
MKKLSALIVLMLLLVSATGNIEKDSAYHSIQGTWELQSFYFYNDNKITDTVPTQDGYRQMKMYYNGKVMWSRTDPRDTIGRFGYGSYVITETELIETIEYGDYQMMMALDTIRNFTFQLNLTDDKHYSQISIDDDGYKTFSENYKRID